MSIATLPAAVLVASLVLLLAMFGLAASGHFPAGHRDARLHGGVGTAILWGTILAALATSFATLALAARVLPWPVAVISAGAALLFAPLVLRPFPDSFVNGRQALVLLSGAALLLAAVGWRLTA